MLTKQLAKVLVAVLGILPVLQILSPIVEAQSSSLSHITTVSAFPTTCREGDIIYKTGTGTGGYIATTGGVGTCAWTPLPYVGSPKASANSKLLGSGSAGVGLPYGEITVGTNLAMIGTTLTATGGGSVTNTGTLTNNAIIAGNGGTDIKVGLAGGNSRLLGSGSSGSGVAYSEITFDSSLTMTGTVLGVTGGTPAQAGRLLGVQVITATGAGTYTPTAGTASIIIELQGAGGGGGGCASPGGTNIAFGRSAGAGGYLRKRLTANFSGASYSVGAKGTGGTAGANDGTDGGNTTFTDTAGSPTVYTASGGGKGVGGTGGAPGGISVTGGAGGSATNGDINIPGATAGFGFSIANPNVVSGMGGASFYGRGGAGQNAGAANSSVAGNNGTGYGSGGSGAAAAGTGAARAGGDGTNGLLIIWEFS